MRLKHSLYVYGCRTSHLLLRLKRRAAGGSSELKEQVTLNAN